MKTEWEITTEEKEPKLNRPLLIEGLPGIGNVGKIAVDFLIEEFKAKKLYTFFSHKFPHSVFVNENNLVEVPKLELYYKQFRNSNKKDLLLLTGDIQPIDEESCYSFCEEIIKIAKQHQCTEIITTGGIGLQNIPEAPKVYCTGNDEQLFKQYVNKKELQIEKNIFGVVGPIIGVSGVLLGLGKKRGIKGVALLAETFGHPMYLGVKGAKELLRVLESKFNYGIDLKKMSKEIIQVEKELLKKTKEWLSEHVTSQAGATARKQETNYIG